MRLNPHTKLPWPIRRRVLHLLRRHKDEGSGPEVHFVARRMGITAAEAEKLIALTKRSLNWKGA